MEFSLKTKQLIPRRNEIVDRFGDWTAHNIHLGEDVYTFDQGHPQYLERLLAQGTHLRRVFQIASDTVHRPLSSLRVLDLGCLEGLYGIEFARHGAEVVGIEGREANIEKARFATEALSLKNITLHQDDVRNLSVERYGQFDVVLCLGILYHLEAPHVFAFLENIAEVCRRVTIIDTHVAINPNTPYVYKGLEYRGLEYKEFSTRTTKEDRLKAAWASLDNEKSFWLTRPSLLNILWRVGFTSVYTCQNPNIPGRWIDRDTLVAIKGQNQELLSTPLVNTLPQEPHTEEDSDEGLTFFQQIRKPSLLDNIRSFVKRTISGR